MECGIPDELEEAETELEATREQLEKMNLFFQLVEKKHVVPMEPEDDFVCWRVYLKTSVAMKLQALYEATLPPVDHSWMDREDPWGEPVDGIPAPEDIQKLDHPVPIPPAEKEEEGQS
jgi:hypothetical protein